MTKARILVVDDESNMRNLLRLYLAQSGFEVTEARNGNEALTLISQPIDLIILDVMMPDLDGWEVCSKIRETQQTPILMLTARTETKDKVHGLNIGADDYLTKPFEQDELIARVNALLRRFHLFETTQSKKMILKEISIDPEARQIYIQDQPVNFTPKEFDLLYFLVTRPQQVFTREALLDHIWGDEYVGGDRTVDTHVKAIRVKAQKAGLSYNPIRTIWGVGYQFQGLDETK